MADGALDHAAILAAARRASDMANAQVAACMPFASKAGREAAGLGLVPSTTSGPGPKIGRVSVELDVHRLRAARLRKSVITGARLHDEEARKGSARGAWYMLTATYREGSDSSPRDVSNLVRGLRRYFHRLAGRKGAGRPVFRYLWVGELTKRLRPHYHLLIWIPRGYYLPKADRAGWWPHGMTKIERARNAVGYLAKYASKFCAGMAEAFPKGFRTHGVGGLGAESKRELRWWKAPLDAREALGEGADIRKVPGGYADKHTGDFWPSPWRVFFDKGRVIAWKLEAIG